MNTITAIYENGVLRPLKPLPLYEQQQVQLQILAEPDSNEDVAAQVVQLLVSEGLLTPPPGQADGFLMNEVERRALSVRLGQAVAESMADYIVAERGEW